MDTPVPPAFVFSRNFRELSSTMLHTDVSKQNDALFCYCSAPKCATNDGKTSWRPVLKFVFIDFWKRRDWGKNGSSKIAARWDVAFKRFSGHYLLWPWPLTFWTQNLTTASMNPSTSVTKLGWNSHHLLVSSAMFVRLSVCLGRA